MGADQTLSDFLDSWLTFVERAERGGDPAVRAVKGRPDAGATGRSST
jgi:hypothetical protein